MFNHITPGESCLRKEASSKNTPEEFKKIIINSKEGKRSSRCVQSPPKQHRNNFLFCLDHNVYVSVEDDTLTAGPVLNEPLSAA